jgi:formate/nitrite transporter
MSEQIYFAPSEMALTASEAALKKSKIPFRRLLVLSILAGMYIGFGGLLVVLVGTGATGLAYGLVKLIMGLVFSIGLILVVVGGAELFTGNTIVALAKAEGHISWLSLFKNWTMVYLGNFIGAIFLALLILLSKQYTFADGAIGEVMFKIASGKLNYSFISALTLGFLCNIFVCLAIWLSYSSKSTGDKILAIIFPITAFVALGFEHSVANMYLLSSAWLIQIFDASFLELHNSSQITLNQIFVNNLLPVTIGNILGGLFIWFAYQFAYKVTYKK